MRLMLYVLRWQMSTPILALVVWMIPGPVLGAVVANLVGALAFYQIDKRIFRGDDNADC